MKNVQAQKQAASRKPAAREADSAEMDRWIAKARHLPAVRKQLVARIKAHIARGNYETPEKLETAVERMIQELGRE